MTDTFDADELIRRNVQAKLDEAARRRQAKAKRRRELERARQRGLAHRRADRERNVKRGGGRQPGDGSTDRAAQ